MTENEIRIINGKEIVLYREIETDLYRFSKDVVDMLLQAFEEAEQYREIGTAEEFKALKEKNEPKKPTEFHENEVCLDFICPNCKEAVYGQPYKPKYCKHCGQKLVWN